MSEYRSSYSGAQVDAAVAKALESKTISAASINASGHLILTFTDSTTLDCGNAKGPAGEMPVKGTDYWTAADKAEIVQATLAALPTWTGGEY